MTKEEVEIQLRYAKIMLEDYEEEDDPEKNTEMIKHYRDMIGELSIILEEYIGDGYEKEEVRETVEDS